MTPPSIAEDFERRNLHKVSLARFTPQHLRAIPLQSSDAPLDRLIERPDNRFHELPVLVLTLPGYSALHDAAILEVSSYTRPYGGGSRLIYLRRTARNWNVVAAQVGCVS